VSGCSPRHMTSASTLSLSWLEATLVGRSSTTLGPPKPGGGRLQPKTLRATSTWHARPAPTRPATHGSRPLRQELHGRGLRVA
jgi:hypothetical protein